MPPAACLFSRPFFLPGQPVKFSVELDQPVAAPASLEVEIYRLETRLAALQARLPAGARRAEFSWPAPAEAPCGYGLEVYLSIPEESAPSLLISSAFDVLARWTQNPRYGFLVNFAPGRGDVAETIDWLARSQVNALQFYDWMYRHDQFLAPEEPYLDPLGRPLSRRVVDEFIQAAHDRGLNAMPYTAVYAASLAFARQHPDWMLLKADGSPELFGEDFLAIMDPRPGAAWTRHLLAQFDQVLESTAFDGIHLDQYGEPKTGYDAQGRSYDLAEPLAALIDSTQAVVRRRRPQGATVFNCVGAWPLEQAAPSAQDITYIEVWPPDSTYERLGQVINRAQRLGGGKPVVIAAYINLKSLASVCLLEAVILANGASHICLGERGGYLSDPYFPRFQRLEPAQQERLLRYQRFGLRYQGVFGPQAVDESALWQGRLRLNAAGEELPSGAQAGAVYPLARRSGRFLALNLLNLRGLQQAAWIENIPGEARTVEHPEPQPTGPLTVELDCPHPVRRAWAASPDDATLALHPLAVDIQDGQLRLILPSLKCWSMILLEENQPEAADGLE